jgi:uncharacterized protein YneF (UPF0154 family)
MDEKIKIVIGIIVLILLIFFALIYVIFLKSWSNETLSKILRTQPKLNEKNIDINGIINKDAKKITKV